MCKSQLIGSEGGWGNTGHVASVSVEAVFMLELAEGRG